MKIPDCGENWGEEYEQTRCLPIVEINTLGAPEAPGAHHQKSAQEDVNHPDDGTPPGLHRIAKTQVDDRRKATGSAWDRHADEILSIRTSGIFRLRIELDIETREAAGSRGQEREGDDCAELNEFVSEIRVKPRRQTKESPHPRKDSGSNAESDNVGERIQLLAEVTGGMGEASNGSVHAIEENSEANRNGGMVEVRGSHA